MVAQLALVIEEPAIWNRRVPQDIFAPAQPNRGRNAGNKL